MIVRTIAHGLGFRYRLHVAGLPGKPDLVFPRHKKIIDVKGCFWHQHEGCIDARIPKSRTDYWEPKLVRNVQRDRDNLAKLQSLGWKVLTLWDCELSNEIATKKKIRSFLRH